MHRRVADRLSGLAVVEVARVSDPVQLREFHVETGWLEERREDSNDVPEKCYCRAVDERFDGFARLKTFILIR